MNNDIIMIIIGVATKTKKFLYTVVLCDFLLNIFIINSRKFLLQINKRIIYKGMIPYLFAFVKDNPPLWIIMVYLKNLVYELSKIMRETKIMLIYLRKRS